MFGKTQSFDDSVLPPELVGDGDSNAREQIEKLFTPLHVSAGRTLIEAGHFGREFFVITAGRAVVLRDGDEVGQLGAGDFCGEIALLEGERRNATVRALTDMKVLVANPREFRALLGASPRFAAAIQAMSSARRLALAS
ncbi:MAG: cyclic nucleotide-binding domain-containing protein [Acidimicrobiia bacterium]|nr:cyclic nucleotide-binding domain-containing protein [Acidimicrobiia bacterium]